MTMANQDTTIPQRQIRAHYDETHIIVYQAYNSSIADAAVTHQRLDASPLYAPSRATWIKPSWAWMLYRSGYSYKDANQARILALYIPQEYFISLLRSAVLAHHDHPKGEGVVVQWDPERDINLEKLNHRSIQIGLMGKTRDSWIKEGISRIEDVTFRARELKTVLDQEKSIDLAELIKRGLVPEEQPFELPADIKGRLEMD